MSNRWETCGRFWLRRSALGSILVFDSQQRGLSSSSLPTTEPFEDADLFSNILVRSFALLGHLDLKSILLEIELNQLLVRYVK